MTFFFKSAVATSLFFATLAQADLTLRPGQSVQIGGERIYCSYDGGTPPGDDRSCRITGRGYFNGFTYAYRVLNGRNGLVLDATHTLRSAVESMDRQARQGNCARPYRSVCELEPRGYFDGFTFTYTLSVDRETLFGANDLRSIVSARDDLRRVGYCTERTNRICRMAGPGYFEGFNYRYTIDMDGRTVFGSNDIGSADRMFSDLRYSDFCR
jgi:hypothetical protein